MDVAQLKPGETYSFSIKDFETPFGEVIPGQTKVRKFVGTQAIGPAGMAKSPFLEVERRDGSKHLIAVDSVQAFCPA